jgi:hypothetical protein
MGASHGRYLRYGRLTTKEDAIMQPLSSTAMAVAAALLLGASSLALAQTVPSGAGAAPPNAVADDANSPMTPGAAAVPLTAAKTPLEGDSPSATTPRRNDGGSARDGSSATMEETSNTKSNSNNQE